MPRYESVYAPTNSKKDRRLPVFFAIGGGGRARTYDLYHVKVAL